MKNHVQMTGHLGANPVMKILDSGQWMARFSIAVKETRKTKNGENILDVKWHAVVATGPLAAIAERLLHRGSEVTIGGQLFYRTFTNREGIKRDITEIIAAELYVPVKNVA